MKPPYSTNEAIKKLATNNCSVTFRQYPYQLLNGILGILFPLITYPYLTRVLGPERLGAIHFVDYAVGLIYGITSLGIPAYGVYRIAQLQATGLSKRQSYTPMMRMHTLLGAIGFGIFYILFADHENWNYVMPLFPLGACYLIANSLASDWYLQGRQHFKTIAIRNLIFRGLGLVFIFLWVKSPSDYSIYYWIIVISVIATAIYNLVWIRRDLKNEAALPVSSSIDRKEMFLFFIATVFISITDYLDATLLGLLSNETEVGFYTNAAKLVRLSLLVTLALNAVVFPQFSGIQAQQQPTRSVELLRKSVDWLIFLTIPISVLYLLLGKELVLVFSGPAFTNSISSVYWMAPIPLFISLSNLLLYYGLSSRPELQKRIAVGVAVGILISIGLNSWLIPLYGAKGAAMNSFLTELGFLIFFLLLIKPTIPVETMLKAGATALIFIPVSMGMEATSWTNLTKLLVGGFSCLMLYGLIQHYIWKHPFLQEGLEMIRKK